MPTVFFGRFGSDFARRPDRMAPGDFEIWARWWPSIADGTVTVIFDVGLGDGLPLSPDSPAGRVLSAPFDFRVLASSPPGSPEKLAFMHLRNSQKRADVIIEREAEVWLVELRFAAQASAIGRLLMYGRLWAEDPVFDKEVRLFLVTDADDPDVRLTAKDFGVSYVVA